MVNTSTSYDSTIENVKDGINMDEILSSVPESQNTEPVSIIEEVKQKKTDFFKKYGIKFDRFMFINNNDKEMLADHSSLLSLIRNNNEANDYEMNLFHKSLKTQVSSLIYQSLDRVKKLLPTDKNSD